jgi:hypothetical protein
VFTIVAAMGFAGLMASPASAAPSGMDMLKGATTIDPSASKVHWRGYRHCHRRYGRRRCHGGPRYYDNYYGWPGISLYFGSRRGHHHRRHGRRHNRRH